MNDNELTLRMHFIPGNKGSLVIKSKTTFFRINRLVNALGFVGEMKHLQMSIYQNGKLDSVYLLRNDAHVQWHLHVRYAGDLVYVGMMKSSPWQQMFEWKGSVEEFRHAVDGMIEKMGQYAFFE